MLEVLLAYLHVTAILTMVVFLSSEAALCRSDWLNAAVVRRLARVDLLYGIAAGAVLLTGLARLIWGAKGWQWYLHNPVFHVKMTLFVLVGLLSLPPTFTFLRWRRRLDAEPGWLPAPADVARTRKWVFIGAHVLLLIPLFAVLMARGWGASA